MQQTSSPPWVRQILLPVTMVVLVLGVPYLLRPVATVLLAIFAGILLAIFLDALAALLRKPVAMPRSLALGLAILLIVLAMAGFGVLAGTQIADQMAKLAEQLPAALEKVRSVMSEKEWLRNFFSQASEDGGGLTGILSRATVVFSTTLEALAHLVIITFTGIFLAVSPTLYRDALLCLLPSPKRPRGEQVLQKLGQVMRWWLAGRLASMAVVGILFTIGLLLIGQPLALILGVIAGLLSFIPFLGPALSVIPAVLIALAESLRMAGWVLVVYLVVQFVESNLITPLIERRAVMIPPAFLVAAQFLMGVLLGFYGVLLATPLVVLFTVLIQMLYIQDVLGDRVRVLGDHGD